MRLTSKTLIVAAVGTMSLVTAATGASAHSGYGDRDGDRLKTVSYINGDGGTNADVDRNCSCFQSSYQKKNAAGDFEYHARVNNTGMTGEQQVTWGMDRDGDGRIDSPRRRLDQGRLVQGRQGRRGPQLRLVVRASSEHAPTRRRRPWGDYAPRSWSCSTTSTW